MRKISFLIFVNLTVLLLVFTACNKPCECEPCEVEKPQTGTGGIKYPENLKPIDWDNYNDVYTVYWNLVHYCSDPPLSLKSNVIKISGWLKLDSYSHYLCNDIEPVFPRIYVWIRFPIQLDPAKKCFLKGKLFFFNDWTVWKNHCRSEPLMIVEDMNDIYFE